MNNSIFKAYDVRGVYPDELTRDDAYRIAFGLVKLLRNQNPKKKLNLVVGEDARISSPVLRGAVVDALMRAGVNISYIGQATTPLFYFSVNKLKADGGIMITASHNPPQYGGLKIVGPEATPIGVDTGLKDIEKFAQEEPEFAKEPGKIEEPNLVNDYVDMIIEKSGISRSSKLKIVIDAGNGMTPIVLKPLMAKLGFSYTPLFFDIDCNFPNHTPDISKAEALVSLRDKVLETKADLGVALDGDGDRIFFVDERGRTVKSEFILALLYKNSAGFFHHPKAVYDLRVSRSVKELLGSSGIRSKPGHSFIKHVMREHDADMGGELSGHFFFKETRYAESSVLAMLKVLHIMHSGKKLSEIIKPFEKYYHSGEINKGIASREQGLKMIAHLKEKYKDGKIDELDGVTVEYPDWWFNLRLSNTEPIVRLVVEAETMDLLSKKILELTAVIKSPSFL